MVKYLSFIFFIFISVVNVYSQEMDIEFESKDSIDCTDIYYKLYVKNFENSIITHWTSPPYLDKKSIEYLQLISELLSESILEIKFIHILILIDENGMPYCYSMIKLNDKFPVIDNVRKAILDKVKLIRFVPAYQGNVPSKSFYILTARKDTKTDRWIFPESTIK